jgi:DNA-binding Lrp family transcriptional regulator
MESTGNKRARAWVLINVEPGQAKEAAAGIWGLKDLEGNNFVVRADIVTGPYDIVVPVDAESMETLTSVILDRIQQVPGVRETLTIVVGVHNPYPPHLGKRYVTEEEAAATNPRIEPGPLGNNPWG